MSNQDWSNETIPSRRIDRSSPQQEEAEQGGSSLSEIPFYVWLMGFVVIVLVLSVCGLWALYLLRGQLAFDGPTPTPIVWTPTPNPTTPTPTPTPEPTPTETAAPTPTVSPEIAIGRYVRVSGTEGFGLSLRSGPGSNYTRMDIAQEGEVFLVVDGPTVSAGEEWWKIRDENNEEREWWAAGNYLEPTDEP